MNFEPFVSADVAAKHCGISRRLLLAMARRGIAGAYPIGCGDFRHRWVFKISELNAAIDPTMRRPPQAETTREYRSQDAIQTRYDRAKGSPR